MAKPKRKRKERAERLHREPIVRRVSELLLTGEPTPWRWTSEARRGLRAGMCLEGMPWHAADKRADDIVRLARHRIGLSRCPTWTEAQGDVPQEREYFYCAGCGGYMHGHDRPWCSRDCQLVLRERRYRVSGRGDELARLHALRVILTGSAKAAQRSCENCDRLIAHQARSDRYCSQACREAQCYHPRASRACDICGTDYHPHPRSTSQFCSDRCAAEGKLRCERVRHGRPAQPDYTRRCVICSGTFQGRARTAMTCSEDCRAEKARRKARAHHEAKKQQLAAHTSTTETPASRGPVHQVTALEGAA
ncbi:MAG: hypothetical protein KIS73_05150 [Enhydrobacter sp.]|nr:hypothetical protein [Enhydrobacter sp.]